jgi:hypothetical protein
MNLFSLSYSAKTNRFNIALEELGMLLKEKCHLRCVSNKREIYTEDFEMQMFDINHAVKKLYLKGNWLMT